MGEFNRQPGTDVPIHANVMGLSLGAAADINGGLAGLGQSLSNNPNQYFPAGLTPERVEAGLCLAPLAMRFLAHTETPDSAPPVAAEEVQERLGAIEALLPEPARQFVAQWQENHPGGDLLGRVGVGVGAAVLGSREARETVNSQLDRAVPYIGILTASEAGPRAQFTTEADHALGMIGQMAAERAERSGRGERVRAKDVAYAIGRLARAAAWGNPEVAEQLPLLAGLVGQARRDGFIDPDSIAPNVQPNLKLVLGTQSIIRALNAALPQERQHRQLEAASGHWLRFFVAGKLRRVTHSLTRIVRGVQNLLPARNAQVHTIVGRLRRAFPLPA